MLKLSSLCLFLLLFSAIVVNAKILSEPLHEEVTPPFAGEYTLVIEGFDWGPAVNKVVLSMGETVKETNSSEFAVYASRNSNDGEISPATASGTRSVVYSYVSDAKGNRTESGEFVTLILGVSPIHPIGSPIQYFRAKGNVWIDYKLTVVQTSSGKVWNTEKDRIMPLVDQFDLNGKFKHSESLTMSYAAFAPKMVKEKAPLIIWLHGGGEGGFDPTIALLGNRAANYASPEIQQFFGDGAYVLVPQAPTFWMQGADGMTRGQTNDMYNVALMALIQDYVKSNSKIDAKRIYVGGCSNGGYMSLKLIMEHPDYFAAGYISALAYGNEFITDAQVQKIKNVPMWFIHSKDDMTTKPDETVVPLYHRLKKAGAKNVVFTYYDNVTDITGFYGGKDYQYNGHWSWIYSHANLARTDFDGSPVLVNGRPVSIMEWLSAQKK
ncbi:prolyl oligopeptidase family serine peptidase [Algoriphagus sp.]|uniref:prolyl oligopeptidase family serine peptidase n=1 Tax=Algoriphagus sp. TaxID=1872435 RepID=UPI0039194BAE